MTRDLLLIVLTLILISCRQECRKVIERYDNSFDKIVHIYPDCNDSTFYKRQFFFKNGKIGSEGHHKNGIKEGQFKSWFENGQLSAEWTVLNGQEHGLIKCWYENGILRKEANVTEGLENGFQKNWYSNGKPESEGAFEYGEMEGMWKFWDEEGNLKIRTYYNDTLSGFTTENWTDSLGQKIIVIGQYLKGKEHGRWRWLDKDSIIYEVATYKDGQLNGLNIKYYTNGEVESQGLLKNGYYEGIVNYFNNKGELTKTERYKDGELLD